MSRTRVFMGFAVSALTSLFLVAGSPALAQNKSVSELLLRDEIQEAETLLEKQPRTAQTIAFRGEIEFRKGHFEQADVLYREALKMDSKNARAHFGLGKLAMGKVKTKVSVQELARAVALDPKEPIYHLYASEAWGTDKNYTKQREELEAYLRLNPADEDRVNEAKAGLEVLKAFGSQEIAVVEAPENPSPIDFLTSLNLIFTSVKLNGKGPYRFAIDSGATQTVISEKVAAELGLQPIATSVVFGIGGPGKVETKLYKIDELTTGDVKGKNTPVGTFNDPLVSQIADGILGTSIFSDFIVTIDYPANELRLSRKRTAAVPGVEVLPVWFFSNLLLVPI